MKYFRFLFFFSVLSFSQWSVKIDNNPRFGKKTTIIAQGNGGKFPYDNPILVFRKTDEKIEILIQNSGPSNCDDLRVEFSFDNESEVLSFTAFQSFNFFEAGLIEIKNLVKVNKLVNALKKNKKAYVRWESKCYQNQFVIPLKNSSRALSSIFDANWISNAKQKP